MTPTALQRIKEIEKNNKAVIIPDSQIEFLLKAFNVMRQIALKQEKETGVFAGVVNADFEKEMSK